MYNMQRGHTHTHTHTPVDAGRQGEGLDGEAHEEGARGRARIYRRLGS